MEDTAGNIAYTFHFPEDEIMSMDKDKLLFWSRQSERINEEIKRQARNK